MMQQDGRFPPETPLVLQRVIMKLVRKEFDELRRCFAESKRRRDSFSTADSSGEIDLSSG